MWLIFAGLSAVTAALMTVTGKLGLKGVDPTLATGIRSLFMFLLMSGIVLVSNKLQGINHLDKRAFLAIGISAFFGALSWLFYFLALRDGAASKVAAVDRLSLILVILFSVAFLAEKVSLKLILGGIFATVGIVLIALG